MGPLLRPVANLFWSRDVTILAFRCTSSTPRWNASRRQGIRSIQLCVRCWCLEMAEEGRDQACTTRHARCGGVAHCRVASQGHCVGPPFASLWRVVIVYHLY